MTRSYAQDPGRIADLARAIRDGSLTASGLLDRCLARIDAAEPAVQAWREVARDAARAEAAALDAEAKAGRFRGPLHGIPVGIKDIIDVRGMTTLANSRSRQGVPPATADAEIVAVLRLAGAVILGKLHTTEFAFFDPSPARNPHDPEHTPGGSSSGSAAAVAAGMVPLALGTQTVASVNRPAAYCGVAAFKPSTQSMPTHGIVPLAPAFDTVGLYGATVADAATLFEAVCPAHLRRPGGAVPERLRIVRLEDPALAGCDPEIMMALGAAAERLAAAGQEVRSASAPDSFAALFETQLMLAKYEAARIHRPLQDAPEGSVGPKFREMLATGLAIPDAHYRDGRALFAAARERFWTAFADTDLLLFPAAPATAPAGLASTGDPSYISPWTGLGGPIVTLPAGRHSNGLPIGILLCGAPGSDRRFAQAARRVAEICGEG